MPLQNEILTIDEIASYLRVSERTVYEWAQKGEIPCGKLGTSWRFRRSEIESWVKAKLGKTKYPQVPPVVHLAGVLVLERCRLLAAATKVESLRELAGVLGRAREVGDAVELEEAIFRREQLMSTGIGLGIGLPHARLHSVSAPVMAVGVSRRPITDYESLDGEPVNVIVMVAAGQDQHAEHIRLLSITSARLKDGAVRDKLRRAKSARQVYDALV